MPPDRISEFTAPESRVKKLILTTGLALLTFVMVMLQTSMQNSHQISYSINQLHVFGDSLSDVGTVYKATGGLYPPNPPYYRGRYSNGPVWVEHLASRLSLSNSQITNTACGGSTTGGGSINGIPGVLAQVENFTKTHPQTSSKTLYVLWAGANDYLNGVANPTVPVANVSRAISALVDMGAKNILVANLPDLGNVPATRKSAFSNALTALTTAHNAGLTKSLATLKQQVGSDVHIIEFNTYALYGEAIANPTQFGFTNVTGACVDNLANCTQPDQFLFWDGIHPTAAAHRILADRAYSLVTTTLPPKSRPEVLQ